MLHDRILPGKRGVPTPTKTSRGIVSRHFSDMPAARGRRLSRKSLLVIAGLGAVAWVPIIAAAVLILG